MRLLALHVSLACLAGSAALGCSPSDGEPAKADAAVDACVAFDAGPAAVPFVDAGDEATPRDVGPVVTRAEIDDIIQNSCAFSSCHGRKPGAGGLYLPAPPNNWVVELVGKPSSIHKTMKLVVAGDPSQSFLLHKLGSGLCALSKDCIDGSCGDRMPQGSTALPAFELAKIVEWVRQGATDK